MPAATGESKQALVITLVCFILLSIILGVFTYVGYSDADKLLKEKTTAESAEKTAKNERTSYRNQMLMYRAYIGEPPQQNKDELRVAYDDVAKGDPESAKVLQDLEKELGWDKAKGLPNTDRKRKIADLEKQKKEVADKLAETEEELNKRKAGLKKAGESLDALKEEYKKKFDELNAKATDDLKKYETAGDSRLKEYGDQGKTIQLLKEEIEKITGDYTKLLKARDKDIKDLRTQLDKLEEKKPRYNALTLDQPKGKIVFMGKTGELPFINLGSADRVKPQLTFAIYALGTDGRPVKESKGSLEVINVVSEHMSQARITNQVDAVRDPVVTGDVLMNFAWDPYQKRHVAIAGVVNLTGDVRTDRPADAKRAMEEFIRAVESRNVVVDAWLDFADNSIKGTGISRNTDYLILAPLPESTRIVKEEEAKERGREDIRKLATKMQDEATKMGVPIIKLRDFLSMTGFRLPRGAAEDTSGKVHSTLPTVGSPVEKNVSPARSNGEGKDK